MTVTLVKYDCLVHNIFMPKPSLDHVSLASDPASPSAPSMEQDCWYSLNWIQGILSEFVERASLRLNKRYKKLASP